MAEEYPIIDRIKEANPLNPLYGSGHGEICQRCREHMNHEHDVEHRICDELDKRVLPTEIRPDGTDAWATVKDLQKLRTGQHGR